MLRRKIEEFKNDPDKVFKAAIIGYVIGATITSIGYRNYRNLPKGSLVITPDMLAEMIDQDTVMTFDNKIHAFVLAPLQSFDPDKLTKFKK